MLKKSGNQLGTGNTQDNTNEIKYSLLSEQKLLEYRIHRSKTEETYFYWASGSWLN